ncbi:TetR family transcriptional regulator [Paractinoplanes ferrugineus]|uniref:TetR family transcriptional regulator n=1 Tax=Paractinoplanes ferrugineus TaxID=113564 RepID=A0A919JAN1_9ACTN|nr:TetR/AcrR family transcriptional regulator C-terminal domain-containing protein [Actinoplanes ferrugineus]GIE15759.1 TetR family transcriptional regulator [Actinoplanes ferrugineus]
MARNTDGLSRERIVETAVELLDSAGESGLTFRALSARLKTGAGAIYWHVANKDELLAAATDGALAGVTAAGRTPEEAIRAVAIDVFDAIDAHPWIGGQLARLTSQRTTLRILERLGQQVQALGVPAEALFYAASALLNYILGVAGQNAANARAQTWGTTRSEVIGAESELWASLDPAEFPFARAIAGQLRDHDDREQFLAGIDLIIAGIKQTSEAGTTQTSESGIK